MPTTARKSKKSRLRAYLAERNPARIDEPEWKQLLADLAPITESYLRRLLHDTGLEFAQPFAGVRQKTFEELEQSLLEMERVYAAAQESGNTQRARYCRSLVIQAKDHARWAARGRQISPEKKARKEEMVQWMLVWLENPGVFPAWVRLRKKRFTESRWS